MTLEHGNTVLEEVQHLCGSLGDRSVNSTEGQTVLPGHVLSVECGVECEAGSLHHFCFYSLDSVV